MMEYRMEMEWNQHSGFNTGIYGLKRKERVSKHDNNDNN